MHPNKNYLITLLPNNRRGVYVVSFAFSTEALCIIAKKTPSALGWRTRHTDGPRHQRETVAKSPRSFEFSRVSRADLVSAPAPSLHHGHFLLRLTSLPHFFFFFLLLQELKVLEGQSVTLRCKARGDPDPIIHWIAPDGRLMSNSSRAEVHTDGTLDILISTVKDSGSLTPRRLGLFFHFIFFPCQSGKNPLLGTFFFFLQDASYILGH